MHPDTDRLVQLAASLLLIASSDQGELQLRRERVVAGEVLRSVRNRFASRAAEASRALVVTAPAELSVLADRVRLEQALGNLVDNALRHGAGPVRLDARAVGETVELSVSDDGPGLRPAFLPRAFERFSRPDTARAGTGTGLGLAIVDAIARAHGGTAHAANGTTGARVWIALPADAGAGPLNSS